MKKSELSLKKKYKIVDYTAEYAEAVAEMWKHSRDGWNGQVLYGSGEAVQRAEASSSHLKLWLAMEGEKVVGYCKLSKFSKEHALYLDYLNVRDDYHGEKIGKMFVLKCVEETIERGFPRLDLYTWGGNLAAIPLYKKCGFVWQRAESSTHCLNFIPAVVSNPLLQKYMKNIDWYDDNARKMEIVPDDITEGKFIYFRYAWEKEGERLEADYCRFGRGLRRIKTKDFEITVKIADRDLVFDQAYRIEYQIENFGSEPLDLKIQGKSDKNVDFDFQQAYQVKKSQTISTEFKVKPVEDEFEKTDILPNVVSELVVNGVKVDFAIGFFPQFPLLLKLNSQHNLWQNGRQQVIYLEMENRLPEAATARLQLPQLPEINFSQPQIELNLAAEEKKSLQLKCSLKQAYFFDQKIQIELQKSDGSKIIFPFRLQKLFSAYDGFAWGETKKMFVASIGSNYLKITKTGSNKNLIWLKNLSSTSGMWMGSPALGDPPSAEFEERFADDVKIYREADLMVVEILYKSEEFSGVEIKRKVTFSLIGFVQQSWQITNRGTQDYSQLQLRDIFGSRHYRVIPYAGKFVHLPQELDLDLQFVKTKDYNENWLYCQDDKQSCGLYWDESLQLHANDWYNQLQGSEKFDLASGAEQKLPSISAVLDRFGNWQDFRNFVLNINEKPALTSFLELKTNDDYPLVDDSLQLQAISQDREKAIKQLELVATDAAEMIEQQQDKAEIKLSSSRTLDFRYNYQEVEFGLKRLFIKEQPGEIREKIVSESNRRIYTLDNGVISFSACAEFAPVIFSLRYKDREWLDNSFPQPGPKSWDNPWTGGLAILPNHLRMGAFLTESSRIDFCTKYDNKGRKWKGIEISTKFLRSEKLEGIIFRQYFLTIESQPILVLAYQIENLSGKLKNIHINARIYPNSDERLRQNVIQTGKLKFYPGKESNYCQMQDSQSYYSKNSADKLHLFPLTTQQDYYGYTMLNDEFYFGGFVHQNLPILDQQKRFELISLLYFDQNEHELAEVKDFSKLCFSDSENDC